jgi:ubiquitin-conjugating enzyme E2 J1
MSASSSENASVATIRRINRELQEIHSNPSPHWSIQSIEDNLLEWHFTIQGPPDTEFENGLYHGRLLLPFNYPFAPPSIMLLNPNGRFEANKKICLSMSNFHPELWQPAWGVRTMMEALRSFFPTPADGAIGGLDWPADLRRSLANESRDWVCSVCMKKNSESLVVAPSDPPALPDEPSVVTQPEEPVPPAPVPTASVLPPVGPGQPSPIAIVNAILVFLVGTIMALLVDLYFRPPFKN